MQFDFLTPHWLQRAHVYHGEQDGVRYRFCMDGKEKTVEASVYTKVCFEKAEDVVTETFPWDEEGVAALRIWMQAQYDRIMSESEGETQA